MPVVDGGVAGGGGVAGDGRGPAKREGKPSGSVTSR